ncbi:MAG TPA: serpin family protein [Propionibacteriaceae bacterium]|nr:serpin family protein [Propionibacteriaceae bacterium]
MISRRALLDLAALAVAGVPVLTGCSSSAPAPDVAQYGAWFAKDVRRAPAAPATTSTLGPFAVALLDRLGAANPVVSPFSLAVVLGMLRNGAAGVTASELQRLFGTTTAQLDAELNAVLQALDAVSARAKVAMSVADAGWAQRDFDLSRAFLEALATWFGVGMIPADFRADPDAARAGVNAWAAKSTRGLIDEILPPGLVDRLTRLVLGNAVYFKGRWKTSFDPARTAGGPFTGGAGQKLRAPLMHSTQRIRFAFGETWMGASVPFADPDLELVLVRPIVRVTGGWDSTRPLGTLAAVGGAAPFDRVLAAPLATHELTMPKWRARFYRNLVGDLAALGVPTLVDERCDLSAVTDSHTPMTVTGVFHRAVFSVAEDGAEAAAVSGGVAGVTAAPADPDPVPTFTSALFYALAHRPSRTLLFLGRLDDPTAS